MQYGLDSRPPRPPRAYWMFSHLSAISKLTPPRVPKQLLHTEVVNQVWHMAAKAMWSVGECLPSLCTLVAEAAKLPGRTLDCLCGCHDGSNRDIFLIF